MENEKILVIDFGGQYNQLIARRVRECGVYCEIYSYKKDLDEVLAMHPKGIIFTGGPNSVYDPTSATYTAEIFKAGIPILGICYGAQLMSHLLGGRVDHAPVREYGKIEVSIDNTSPLFEGIQAQTICWMSHNDYIAEMAPGFRAIAHSDHCPYAAVEDSSRKLYGVQFHPEVLHTQEGTKMLSNFVYHVCGCAGDWKMSDFVEQSIRQLRETVGDKQVVLGLSGGVDSSVVAALLSRAIGSQLTCIFVDHGLLRKNEADEVEAVFGSKGNFDLNFIRVDASARFYRKLRFATEPEHKRKIIGKQFVRVFEETAAGLDHPDFLAQGTIYPDVVESGLGGESATIKSHHNVGGLPKHTRFKGLIEPLRYLFKDEVRQVGLQLGLPESLIYRQPFPGPGLGIRIIGRITPEKVRIVQEADAIWREELLAAGLGSQVNQYFAALTNMRSVGVMGDERTYDYAIALRAVTTQDFMTAEAAEIPWEFLSRVTNRIVNEVPHVNRVFYDCTGKPPATVEYE